MKSNSVPAPAAPNSPVVIPILLPVGRDAELVARVVSGIDQANAVICPSMQALLAQIDAGCGPFVIGDEVLDEANLRRLSDLLEAQPEWSDLPGIILTGYSPRRNWLQALASRKETVVLQRPVGKAVLASMIKSAVAVRRRQLQVRDLVDDLVRANEKLWARTARLQMLALEMTRVEDRERKRIAHILHDDLQQMLASARLQTEMLLDHLDEGAARNAEMVYDILTQAMQAARSLSHELNPMVTRRARLEDSLTQLAERMTENYKLDIQCTLAPTGEAMADDIKRFVYRSVQELLFNCAKHARAGHVFLEMGVQDGNLTVTLTDDGVGFDPDRLQIRGGDAGGYGLFSIQERVSALNGVFQVHSAPGEGSRFVLTVPCDIAGSASPSG